MGQNYNQAASGGGPAILQGLALWDAATAYSVDDEVIYDDGGTLKIYTALQANTNSTPASNPLDWQEVSPSVAGPTTFTGLTDTPASYVGAGGDFVLVNGGATALEFVDGSSINVSVFNNDAGYLTAVPLTDDRIPRGTGTDIEDGTWVNDGNHIYPFTTGSNIGQASNRIGTIFMSSTIDYSSSIIFDSSGGTGLLDTAGKLTLGSSTPTAAGGFLNLRGGQTVMQQIHTDTGAAAFVGLTSEIRWYHNDTGVTPRQSSIIYSRVSTVGATSVDADIVINEGMKVSDESVIIGDAIATQPIIAQLYVRGDSYSGAVHFEVRGKDNAGGTTNMRLRNNSNTDLFTVSNNGKTIISPQAGSLDDFTITNTVGSKNRVEMGTLNTSGFLRVVGFGAENLRVDTSDANIAGRIALNGLPIMVSIAEKNMNKADFVTVGGVGNNSSLFNGLLESSVTDPTDAEAVVMAMRQRDTTDGNLAVTAYIDSANSVIASNGFEFDHTTPADGVFKWWSGTTALFSIKQGGVINIEPITAAAASALTAAQGDVVCVSTTDATFTAVGFWGYDGTDWIQF